VLLVLYSSPQTGGDPVVGDKSYSTHSLIDRREGVLSVIDSNDNVGSVDRSKVGGVQTKPKGSAERSRYVDYRCDYHPAFQQMAFMDADTGEFQEKRRRIARDAKRAT
jgi:hypothetical protein